MATGITSSALDVVTKSLAGPANFKDPLTKSPVTLQSGLQEKATLSPGTVDPATRALYRYRNPYQIENSGAYQASRGVRNYMLGPNPLGNILNKGPLMGGLAMGAGGLALGAGAGLATNAITGQSGNVGKLALLMALLGTGVGAYSGYQRTRNPAMLPAKTAGYWRSTATADPKAAIIQMLQGAPGLSFQQRSQFMSGVSQLDPGSATQLNQLLASASGAAIGAIIAKFLMNAGLVGVVMSAMLGGVIGRAVVPSSATNAAGQTSLGNKDIFGRPISI